MKKMLKLASLAALALTFSGCGKNGDAVVPEKTVVAAYVDIEKAYDDGKDWAKEVIDSLPSEMREDAKKNQEGVCKVIDEVKNQLNPKWAVIAFGGTFNDLSNMPEKCGAIAVKVDMDEDAVAKLLKKAVDDEKAVTIERENGNVIYNIDAKVGRIGLVEGKYLIAGTSKEAFEDMFDLYAGKGMASKEFDDLSRISGDIVCRIQTAPVSSLLKRFEFAKYVEEFGESCQDKDLADMILNMGSVSLDMGIADGGETVMRFECDSSDHAEMVGKVLHLWAFINRLTVDSALFFVKKGMIPGSPNFAQSDLLRKVLRSSEASRSGNTAEFRSGLISNPFVFAGALFPAISSATLNANLTSMSFKGRRLCNSIIMANMEREIAGKGTTVWPRTAIKKASDDGNNADIGDRAFRSTTDYFNALLNRSKGSI